VLRGARELRTLEPESLRTSEKVCVQKPETRSQWTEVRDDRGLQTADGGSDGNV